jgi:hypothetical protein
MSPTNESARAYLALERFFVHRQDNCDPPEGEHAKSNAIPASIAIDERLTT